MGVAGLEDRVQSRRHSKDPVIWQVFPKQEERLHAFPLYVYSWSIRLIGREEFPNPLTSAVMFQRVPCLATEHASVPPSLESPANAPPIPEHAPILRGYAWGTMVSNCVETAQSPSCQNTRCLGELPTAQLVPQMMLHRV